MEELILLLFAVATVAGFAMARAGVVDNPFIVPVALSVVSIPCLLVVALVQAVVG